MGKTFKREIAVALLLWLAYIVEVKDVEIIQILVWPVFTYVGAAFGLDAFGKLQQSRDKSVDGRGSKRSSEHTDWENK